MTLPPPADAATPGIALAQGIGKLGHWFNSEVCGGPTGLSWALAIHEWDQDACKAVIGADGLPRCWVRSTRRSWWSWMPSR
ncbi:prolipoprotein diacylglyceryl transferase family protein [Lentzea sp. NPDC058450]|uniref:prolipoprotein diacylglyceryl transferase family protein n=1 Tax=Lentzea sp. NPDC058450 TaxID=3346505 RepID=UPI0036572343